MNMTVASKQSDDGDKGDNDLSGWQNQLSSVFLVVEPSNIIFLV